MGTGQTSVKRYTPPSLPPHRVRHRNAIFHRLVRDSAR
jgi:hypothetical protein